ncbi:MAG: DedA family protein [Elusimicrobia bacterium]|nr:DedA family protein [Elusimicrobiota bacterium]
MDILGHIIDGLVYAFQVFLHLDKTLGAVIQDYGAWTYLILFLIIFCETGLVVTPILPGDSLLFAVGTFAAMQYLDIYKLWPLLVLAAILGDNVNYAVGNYIGPKVFHYENSRIFKKEYLAKTHDFYEKYGGKAIILCKYVPIIRTFAPFVAGVGAMTYPRFLMFNVIGGFTWVTLITFAGYFFGNIPVIRNNFSFVVLAIIVISVLPAVLEYVKHRRSSAAA